MGEGRKGDSSREVSRHECSDLEDLGVEENPNPLCQTITLEVHIFSAVFWLNCHQEQVTPKVDLQTQSLEKFF